MKQYLLLLTALILPIQIFAFSLVGSPVKVPGEKQYIIYSNQLEQKALPNTKDAAIATTLLVYNIQTQASKSTEMFYLKDNQLHNFSDSVWAIPVSKMLTVAIFEYLLDHNVVDSLAFQDINIRQDFTLSGTTSYGPIIDLDNKQFLFHITFYLKNEKTNDTKIKTIKYQEKLISDDVSADLYAKLTNHALSNILKNLKPWLVDNLKIQKTKSKNTAGTQNLFNLEESIKK
jgi:hypothetical protein